LENRHTLGRLPDEAELKRLRKNDVTALPPGVHFRYRRELEPPHQSEGFSRIDIVPFERRYDDALGESSRDCLVRRRADAEPLRRARPTGA
jgi:hypothetical protein